MKKKKLNLSDFDIFDYKLLGIHSQLEPFKIAYRINSAFEISFKRMENNLDLTQGDRLIGFPIFDYYNQAWDITSYLVSNKVLIEDTLTTRSNALGLESLMSEAYLLNDFKRVDYLLKIEDELNIYDTELIIKKLKQISQVSMVYTIDLGSIKHPEHLILN